MQSSRLIAGSLLALSATGCLATKGDIRLLQDELRATRASVAHSDSLQRRTSDSLAAAISALAAAQTRGDESLERAQQKSNEDLKALTSRVGTMDINTREQLKSLGDDIDQVRELARQNARGAAAVRAQIEQARPVPAAAPPDSGATAAAPATTAAVPGSATLLVTGRGLIMNGSCSTARRSFQDILTNYPNSPEAPDAQYLIAESYVSCGEGGNAAKADSVYKIVTEKWPKSDLAAYSLYKRGEMLRAAGKPDLAKPLFQRVVCEYQKSDVYAQALDRLGSRPVCK